MNLARPMHDSEAKPEAKPTNNGGEAGEPARRSTECGICHRPLSDPKSIAIGIGPICRGRVARGEVDKSQFKLGDFFLDEPEIRERIVLRRMEGNPYTNVARTCVHHSPDGFEWGYGGSGPSDLALNICEIIVANMDIPKEGRAFRVGLWDEGTCSGEAWALHHDFKGQFIAGVPEEGGEIEWQEAFDWCDIALSALREKGEV